MNDSNAVSNNKEKDVGYAMSIWSSLILAVVVAVVATYWPITTAAISGLLAIGGCMGIFQKGASSKFRFQMASLTAALVFGLLIAIGGMGIKDSTNQQPRKTKLTAKGPPTTARNKPQPNHKWYEGGNLHKKTIADWKEATQENRLATSADFITTMTGEISKEKSIEVAACLTAFASGAEASLMDKKVSDVGVLCAAQLGYVQR